MDTSENKAPSIQNNALARHIPRASIPIRGTRQRVQLYSTFRISKWKTCLEIVLCLFYMPRFYLCLSSNIIIGA